MRCGSVEIKMQHNSNSISRIAQENAKKVAYSLTSLVAIIATFSAIVAYISLTSNRLSEALESQRRNFSYWLQVGDSFQIGRTLKNLHEANNEIHYILSSKEGSLWTSSELTESESLIGHSKKTILLYGSDDRELGKLTIIKENPLELLLLLVSCIFLIAPLFYAITKRYFKIFGWQLTLPIIELGKSITESNTLNSLKSLKDENVAIYEIDKLNQLLSQLAIRVENQQEKLQSAELALVKEDIANQVAHDIRSPVSALQLILSSTQFDQEHKFVAIESLKRINEIAENLLHERKTVVPQKSNIDLYELTKIICAEKEIMSSKSNISLEIDGSTYTSNIQPDDYKRILSNILNNSLEAIDDKGNIHVKLYSKSNVGYIEIKDSGRGIPPEQLSKLMSKGATFGKENGNGLGLYYAKKTLEKYNGKILIKSVLGQGTIVQVMLPILNTVQDTEGVITDVLIEDDPLIRKLWHYEAKTYGRKLILFESKNELMSNINVIPKDASIYIDSNLNESTKGEELAEKLSQIGYTKLFMASGYNPEHFKDLHFLSGVVGKTPPWSHVN